MAENILATTRYDIISRRSYLLLPNLVWDWSDEQPTADGGKTSETGFGPMVEGAVILDFDRQRPKTAEKAVQRRSDVEKQA